MLGKEGWLDVRIGNGAIGEFCRLSIQNMPQSTTICLYFSNFSFFEKSTASSGLGTPDDTAHSGTNDLALIAGSAARKRSPSVNVSEKCKRMKLNQSGHFLVCQ